MAHGSQSTTSASKPWAMPCPHWCVKHALQAYMAEVKATMEGGEEQAKSPKSGKGHKKK